MKQYISKMLKKYKRAARVSFAMPGHKNRRKIKHCLKLPDVTELSDTDSLHNPQRGVKDALLQMAKIQGSDQSFIMVNGSTGGVLTMLAASCKRGESVLLSRACHISAINACIILGLKPIFFEHKIYEEYSIHGEADIEDLVKKLENNRIKAVLVTSPNYYGIISDIKRIAHILKGTGIPLLVDEAHGAHFVAGGFLPESAIKLGADMSVVSTHKTLSALNQTAVLNVKSKIITPKRVADIIAMFETSSPSYILASSAEKAVAECVTKPMRWKRLVNRCEKLKKELELKTDIKIPSVNDGIFELDPTRLVFNFSAYEISGNEVSDFLREYHNIDIEMSDTENIVLIPSAENTAEDFYLLKRALLHLCKITEKRSEEKADAHLPSIAEHDMSPADAFYADSEYVSPENGVGRISAKTVIVYPPAVPVLIPGAIITEEALEYLQNSEGKIIGMQNGKFCVVKGERND